MVERIKDRISYNRDLVGVMIKDNISLSRVLIKMIHPLKVLRTSFCKIRASEVKSCKAIGIDDKR